MKRVGNLTEKIGSFENLQFAFYKAKKGKEQKEEVKRYAQNLGKNLKELQKQILTGQVEVGHYHFFTIYDPKKRLICAASFPERVLHHALMNICGEYFEKYLIDDTYATRINKGQYKALDTAKRNQSNYKWYIKFDVRKYFDSIDHAVLLKLLKTKFKDKTLLQIFEKIIKSYNANDGQGLPIGNLTSQYFANMYLGLLDNYIKHQLKIKDYVRYMDDFTIWNDDKQALKNYGKLISEFLKIELKLDLKTYLLNRADNGLSFLSYRLYPHKILLSQRAKKRFKRKTERYYHKLDSGEWSQEEFAGHCRPLISFTEYAYSKQFRLKILEKYGH